jgi:hypothetical protein
MVLEMIRWEGWSDRAIAQWRLKVSKLGLKGPSNPMRQHFLRPDRGPMGQIKGLLSRNIYSRIELDNSSKPNRIGQKAARQKTTAIKKELLTPSPGLLQKGVNEVCDDDDE